MEKPLGIREQWFGLSFHAVNSFAVLGRQNKAHCHPAGAEGRYPGESDGRFTIMRWILQGADRSILPYVSS